MIITKTLAQKRADAKYNAKAYEQIKISSRRENRISEMVDLACIKVGKSKAQYILDAIKVQLEIDGINIDMLLPVDRETD